MGIVMGIHIYIDSPIKSEIQIHKVRDLSPLTKSGKQAYKIRNTIIEN